MSASRIERAGASHPSSLRVVGVLAAIVVVGLIAGVGAPASALALSGASSKGSAAAAQYSHESVQSGGLPFTGYLLIAVILVGLILLSSGLLIRRRAHARR